MDYNYDGFTFGEVLSGWNPEVRVVRSFLPNQIAEEICSVQPMDEAGKALDALYELLKANPGSYLTFRLKGDDNDSKS